MEVGPGKRLETEKPLWRLTRKWAFRRQWYSGWRGFDLTAHEDAAIGMGGEQLTDSQVSSADGARGDSGTSHQDGESGHDQAWGDGTRYFGGIMSLQVCKSMWRCGSCHLGEGQRGGFDMIGISELPNRV